MNALVIGGNSGIGLAIACQLVKKDYNKVYIFGKGDIDYDVLSDSIAEAFRKKVIYRKIDLVNLDLSFLKSIDDINALFVTAGFGRATLFSNLTCKEIENLIKVNLCSVVEIVKFFYDSINSQNDFFTSIMVSICGRVVSPFFSVYSATKGGLRFFIESINCELQSNGIKNRILEVSPGSIDGTGFGGGKTKLNILECLAHEIVEKTFSRETLFIPKHDSIFRDVIRRYEKDPIKFGLDSYKYKASSGRIVNKSNLIIGYLSGTFDLFHVGHLNLLKRAKEQCDYLIVSVHRSGAWKGKETFIPYNERVEIVKSIKYVDEIADDYAEDSDAWDVYHYDRLFVGSDYKGTDRFNRYEELLSGKAAIVYFPYTQGTSSTQLRDALKKNNK